MRLRRPYFVLFGFSVLLAFSFGNCGRIGSRLGGNFSGGGDPYFDGGDPNLAPNTPSLIPLPPPTKRTIQDSTDTGNPPTPPELTSFKVAEAGCAVISSCNNLGDNIDCGNSIMDSSQMPLRVGVSNKEFPQYAAVVGAEKGGKIHPNMKAYNSCVKQIRNLDCSSEEVRRAYEPATRNPYRNVHEIVPLSSDCVTIFLK